MRQAQPQTICRSDYQPPSHRIERIELTFELEESTTRISSRFWAHPENPSTTALFLHGEDLELEDLRLDGLPLPPSRWHKTDEGLQLDALPPGRFQLDIVTRVNPKNNSALEGLYLSDGFFCTQCEAEGFRKMTYFPDRPDVMTLFTTTLIADKARFPVLLSNGNPVAAGDLLNGRHYAQWEDPFPKPSYLFALVAGSLDCLEDQFTTASGRSVRLQIFAAAEDIGKCGHALESLKAAMRWDEIRFGREYDLDLYMIVAVAQFNMGAMENKGLNLFNTRYVLASPETATDSDYEHIEGVIAHEYFHNWTGNRVTLRDWFQLSLKEGLTVFRDQEFSADRHSRSVKRIDEVVHLRNRQFAEDAGPLAHPVRPDSYMEINNFYTLTVYEKGAEVVRMLETLFGREGFRRGMDLYFDRHDGQAVTCDDFLACMEQANQTDLTTFSRWYSQAGTPEVTVEEAYDAKAKTLTLVFSQSCPPSPGQTEKAPLVIPCALGFVAVDGTSVAPRLISESQSPTRETRVLRLEGPATVFTFRDIPEGTISSVFRGFSAPVKVRQQRSAERLAFQFSQDPDPFNAWDAGQTLATDTLLALYRGDEETSSFRLLVDAYRKILRSPTEDLAGLALKLSLPGIDYVGTSLGRHDPLRLAAAHHQLKHRLSQELFDIWRHHYRQPHAVGPEEFGREASARRRFNNLCLGYLGFSGHSGIESLALDQFEQSQNMTDRMAALSVLVDHAYPAATEALHRFHEQWQHEDLVVCKWLAIQAAAPGERTLGEVKALLIHPAFDWSSPNLVRSLIGTYSQSNPLGFHRADGAGYDWLADCVLRLDALNPQMAARMVTPLTTWRRYEGRHPDLIKKALERVASTRDLSRDVYEVASKSLA